MAQSQPAKNKLARRIASAVCRLLGHREKVQSMRRDGTWWDSPDYPMDWAGTRPSVRAVCRRCGKVTRA